MPKDANAVPPSPPAPAPAPAPAAVTAAECVRPAAWLRLGHDPRVLAYHASVEMLATALFGFGNFAIVQAAEASWRRNVAVMAGTSHAVLVMLMVYVFGDRSGAYMNPLFSISAWLYGSISFRHLLAYIPAELAGAALGGGALYRIVSGHEADATHFGHCGIGDLGADRAFLAEMFFDLIFLTIGYGVLLSDRRPMFGHSFSVLIFVLGLAWLITYSNTAVEGFNTSLNPALCFASAVFYGEWNHQYVFWLACFAAVALNAATFHIHRLGDTTAKEKKDGDTSASDEEKGRDTRNADRSFMRASDFGVSMHEQPPMAHLSSDETTATNA